jgi:hypothetical protein
MLQLLIEASKVCVIKWPAVALIQNGNLTYLFVYMKAITLAAKQ